MAQQDKKGIVSLDAWRTGGLRLTAFPHPDSHSLEPTWWADIVGTVPESRTSRPSKGEFQEEGLVGEGKLLLTIKPGRIDWNQLPPGDQDEEFRPWVGSLPDSLALFKSLLSRWLPHCPQIIRLAFGAILLFPVENQLAGYEMISSYLPSVKVDPQGSSDFFYRINRPRQSTTDVKGLNINRLSQWSVATWERVNLSVAPGAVHGTKAARLLVATKIELDINTSQHFEGPLPKEKLSLILEELVDLGMEIVSKGDIP